MTQDAFIKAYKNYDTLEKPENARAWLYQIAHRVALDEIRRRKIVRFFPWTGESQGSAPSAEHLVMDARLSGEMQRALERIPERQRAALLLAELHDLTGLELAAALGVSHVAARALLTRARESLRQALAAERPPRRRRGRGRAAADAPAPTRAAPMSRSGACRAGPTTGPRRTSAPGPGPPSGSTPRWSRPRPPGSTSTSPAAPTAARSPTPTTPTGSRCGPPRADPRAAARPVGADGRRASSRRPPGRRGRPRPARGSRGRPSASLAGSPSSPSSSARRPCRGGWLASAEHPARRPTAARERRARHRSPRPGPTPMPVDAGDVGWFATLGPDGTFAYNVRRSTRSARPDDQPDCAPVATTRRSQRRPGHLAQVASSTPGPAARDRGRLGRRPAADQVFVTTRLARADRDADSDPDRDAKPTATPTPTRRRPRRRPDHDVAEPESARRPRRRPPAPRPRSGRPAPPTPTPTVDPTATPSPARPAERSPTPRRSRRPPSPRSPRRSRSRSGVIGRRRVRRVLAGRRPGSRSRPGRPTGRPARTSTSGGSVTTRPGRSPTTSRASSPSWQDDRIIGSRPASDAADRR